MEFSCCHCFKNARIDQIHIRYLEWFCCRETIRIGKTSLTNKSLSNEEPFVTESMKADLMEIFDTITLLLSTLDYQVFDEAIQMDEDHNFFCTASGVLAKGTKVHDGFIVFKESSEVDGANVMTGSDLSDKELASLTDDLCD